MPNLYQFASILMQNRVFCFKIRKQKETVVFRSYSLGPLMKYCLIAFIQLIETCISLGWRLVKYKFQFVEFRQYDNISFMDQGNNSVYRTSPRAVYSLYHDNYSTRLLVA